MPMKPPVHRPRGYQAPEQRRQDYDKWRGNAADRLYDHHWTKVRNAFIAEFPLCAACLEQDVLTPATLVDHVIPVRIRPDLRLDPSNLQSLDDACHRAKTLADMVKWPQLRSMTGI